MRPLPWQLIREGRQAVCESEEEGAVVWMGLALSFVLLCRASELFAYDDTESVHPNTQRPYFPPRVH